MNLQSMINSQAPNTRLDLPPGEFFGQVMIDRPITIVGSGKGTWIGSKTSPTIRITSPGVRLSNLMVEVTTSRQAIAIDAAPGTEPVLENVIVRGGTSQVPRQNVLDTRTKRTAPGVRISYEPPRLKSDSVPDKLNRFRPREPDNARSAETREFTQSQAQESLGASPTSSRRLVLIGACVAIVFIALSIMIFTGRIQYQIGEVYYVGKIFAKDYAEAAKWFGRAAEQGYVKGQRNIGGMLKVGRGVTQDYDEALKWFRNCAERGLSCCQNNLGSMYLNGQGVTTDIDRGVELIRKSAWNESDTCGCGKKHLGWLHKIGQGVPEDYSRALSWYRKAAKLGHSCAQNNIGSMYQYGQGVPTNVVEALKWYRESANNPNDNCGCGKCSLGQMYQEGDGVRKDLAEAVKWYRKAAELGNERAKAKLSVLGERQ